MLTEWIRCSLKIQQKGERRNVWLRGDGPVRIQIAGPVQEQHPQRPRGRRWGECRVRQASDSEDTRVTQSPTDKLGTEP